MFFGLGSTGFAYLWFKSRSFLEDWAGGNLLVVVGVIANLAIMVFPSLVDLVIPVNFEPIFIFEVTLGFWLRALHMH